MLAIQAPLKSGNSSPAVANLQTAMLALFKKAFSVLGGIVPKQTNQAGSSRVLLPEKGTNAGRVPGLERTRSDPHWAPHSSARPHKHEVEVKRWLKLARAIMSRTEVARVQGLGDLTQ
jgi:hypothetical protein